LAIHSAAPGDGQRLEARIAQRRSFNPEQSLRTPSAWLAYQLLDSCPPCRRFCDHRWRFPWPSNRAGHLAV